MNALLLAAALFAVDGHADTPQFLLDLGTDLTQAGEQMVDLPKARKGGLGGEFFSIWVDPTNNDRRLLQRALDLIDAVRLQPLNWRAWLELGEFEARQKDYPRAIPPLERAVQLDPQSTAPRAELETVRKLAG